MVSYKRLMNHALLAFLVFQYDDALWITVDPKTVRKDEVWYFIQWEDRLGLGQTLLSHRAFRFALRSWSEAAVVVADHNDRAS